MQNFPAKQTLKKEIIFEKYQYTTFVKIDSWQRVLELNRKTGDSTRVSQMKTLNIFLNTIYCA
jgi:hypothetical protein